MNNTADKQINKNIKHIPTELNYFYHTHRMIKRLKQHSNINRLIILALIIWNIVLTVQLIQPSSIPTFTDTENQMIILEEGI